MAISVKIAKSIQTTSGAAATHWVIRRIIVDVVNKTVSIAVMGYVSQAAASVGATPLDDRSYDMSPADLNGVFSSGKDFISSIYAWLVANTTDFAGGVVT